MGASLRYPLELPLPLLLSLAFRSSEASWRSAALTAGSQCTVSVKIQYLPLRSSCFMQDPLFILLICQASRAQDHILQFTNEWTTYVYTYLLFFTKRQTPFLCMRVFANVHSHSLQSCFMHRIDYIELSRR